MSNLQRLRDNISAIEYALTGKGDAQVLNKYTGFGGLGFILNPIADKNKWNKTDMTCYQDWVRLHEVRKANCADEKQYKKWLASLKASTLTAFYTPEEVSDAILFPICKSMRTDCAKVERRAMLDPAAGRGAFISSAFIGGFAHGIDVRATVYEKDRLTGLLLKAASPFCRTDIRIDGF